MLNQRFIVFEGLDGAGKSTLMQLFKAELEKSGDSVLLTREPGGTELGEKIRSLILARGTESPSPKTELLLYEAARAQHVDLFIRPKLNEGHWVLCDRFSASSVAFQSGGRSISEKNVEWLNDFATESLYPKITILLDLSYDEAQRRQKKRFEVVQQELDRMEMENRAFHERVRASFLNQASKAEIQNQGSSTPHHWIVLSADKSPSEILNELMSELKERGLWGSLKQP